MSNVIHILTGRPLDPDAVRNLVWMPVMDLWSSGWEAGEPSAPTVLPTCLGVRTNSTQACEHWTAAEDVAL